MAQCPLCKRNAAVERGRCGRCGGDLTALQAVRDLPLHLFNAGVASARDGDSLDALLKLGAASQLGERPEPWVALGKVFANEGAIDRARACFAKAAALDGTVPAFAVAVAAPDAIAAAPARTAPSPTAWRWAVAALVFSLGAGAGWIARSTRTVTSTALPSVAAVAATPAPEVRATADPPVAARRPSSRKHVVASGDTLWQIAHHQLGAGPRWIEILDADENPVADPRRLIVGQVLTVPEPADARTSRD